MISTKFNSSCKVQQKKGEQKTINIKTIIMLIVQKTKIMTNL